jgi:pimeloyl-ACP methyl ester carboxylesterase
MSAIILESSLVHYESLGRGKPLLFLHDWLGTWRYWVPTMLELSSSYRAYAMDFWGFGDSAKVRNRYSVDGYVGQLAMFMEQMGIVKVPLVGHGLGGVVALHFAEKFPDMVEQVLGVNVPLMGGHINRPLSGFDGGDKPLARILGRHLTDHQEIATEAAKTEGEAIVETLRSFMNDNLTDFLEDTDIPIMLAYGMQSPFIQVPEDDLFQELDENVYPYFLDGIQHYPMLEESSKFTRLLLDFLINKNNWDAIQVKDGWRRRMR